MGRRPLENLDPVYLGELAIQGTRVAGRPGRGRKEGYRGPMAEGSTFSKLLALYDVGSLLAFASARSWSPRRLCIAQEEGDQALHQRCLQVGLGRYCIQHNKSRGENDCFLPQHKFYYTSFHYKNVTVWGMCLLHKQSSYSDPHHLSNQSLKGNFIY